MVVFERRRGGRSVSNRRSRLNNRKVVGYWAIQYSYSFGLQFGCVFGTHRRLERICSRRLLHHIQVSQTSGRIHSEAAKHDNTRESPPTYRDSVPRELKKVEGLFMRVDLLINSYSVQYCRWLCHDGSGGDSALTQPCDFTAIFHRVPIDFLVFYKNLSYPEFARVFGTYTCTRRSTYLCYLYRT